MVSEERAKLMAKAEIMREKEWDRALKLGRFYRRDYISYKMIRSAFSFVFAYLLVFVMWALYHAEEFMTQKQITELADMGIRALILLACLLACFLVISYFVYRAKYKRAREKIKSYQGLLKQIDRLYEKESVKVKKESEEFEV